MSAAAWVAVVLGSLVLLAGAGAAVWLSRLRTLARRVGSFHCLLTEAEASAGIRGVAQYGATALYWWRRASVVPRPARIWARGSIAVLERTVLPIVPGRPPAVVARCRVACVGGGAPHEVQIQMSADAYAGFTSWLEATPSRVGTVI